MKVGIILFVLLAVVFVTAVCKKSTQKPRKLEGVKKTTAFVQKVEKYVNKGSKGIPQASSSSGGKKDSKSKPAPSSAKSSPSPSPSIKKPTQEKVQKQQNNENFEEQCGYAPSYSEKPSSKRTKNTEEVPRGCPCKNKQNNDEPRTTCPEIRSETCPETRPDAKCPTSPPSQGDSNSPQHCPCTRTRRCELPRQELQRCHDYQASQPCGCGHQAFPTININTFRPSSQLESESNASEQGEEESIEDDSNEVEEEETIEVEFEETEPQESETTDGTENEGHCFRDI